MFCPNCKNEMVSQGNENVCPHCGMRINTNQMYSAQQNPIYTNQPQHVHADSPSFGFGCLSFFIPLVGFILWLVWRKDFPHKAKSAGIGALINIILNIIIIVSVVVAGPNSGGNGQGAFNIIGALAFKFFGI